MGIVVDANYLRKSADGLDVSDPSTFRLASSLIGLAAAFDAYLSANPGASVNAWIATLGGGASQSDVDALTAALGSLAIGGVSGLQSALDNLQTAINGAATSQSVTDAVTAEASARDVAITAAVGGIKYDGSYYSTASLAAAVSSGKSNNPDARAGYSFVAVFVDPGAAVGAQVLQAQVWTRARVGASGSALEWVLVSGSAAGVRRATISNGDAIPVDASSILIETPAVAGLPVDADSVPYHAITLGLPTATSPTIRFVRNGPLAARIEAPAGTLTSQGETGDPNGAGDILNLPFDLYGGEAHPRGDGSGWDLVLDVVPDGVTQQELADATQRPVIVVNSESDALARTLVGNRTYLADTISGAVTLPLGGDVPDLRGVRVLRRGPNPVVIAPVAGYTTEGVADGLVMNLDGTSVDLYRRGSQFFVAEAVGAALREQVFAQYPRSDVVNLRFTDAADLPHSITTSDGSDYTAEYPDGSIVTISSGASHVQSFGAPTSGLVRIRTAIDVRITHLKIDDATWSFDLSVLSPLTSLVNLKLAGHSMDLTGPLAALSPLVLLTSLHISGHAMRLTGVTDALSPLVLLANVYIAGHKMAIAGDSAAFSPLIALRTLYVIGQDMTIEMELSAFAPLPLLEVLFLIGDTMQASLVDTTWRPSMRQVVVKVAPTSEAFVGAVLSTLARDTTTWRNEKQIDLRGSNPPPPISSQSDITTLEGLGVAVLVESGA